MRSVLVGLRAEPGSFAVELAVLAPVVVALVLFSISAGQLVNAHSALENAVSDAARAATVNGGVDASGSGDPATFVAAGQSALRQALPDSGSGIDCSPGQVTSPAEPAGSPLTGNVDVQVRCQVRTVSGLHIQLTAHAASPIDAYR